MKEIRDLLRLAAKAARIDRYEWVSVVDGEHAMHVWNGEICTEFGPHRFYSDALRLAEKLKLTLDLECGVIWGAGEREYDKLADVGDDGLCMAIVRAAAAIGEGME